MANPTPLVVVFKSTYFMHSEPFPFLKRATLDIPDLLSCRYTYWMGEMPIVAVNDYKKIIETFQKNGDAYAGRTWLHEWSEYLGGNYSDSRLAT